MKEERPASGLRAKPELGPGLLLAQDQLLEGWGVGKGSAQPSEDMARTLCLECHQHSIVATGGLLAVYDAEAGPHGKDSGIDR